MMTRHARRIVVFVAGLLSILVGLVLILLPGPLTIPPIILGVWLWSREFAWADRWMEPVRVQGEAAKEQFRKRPIRTTTASVLGIVAAVVLIWAVLHYDLVARAKELVGLG
ncbi:MAG: PGPGW domain-containing protein [Nocardioides sp.]